MAEHANGRIAWLQLALTAVIIGGGLWSFAIAPVKTDVSRSLLQSDDALKLATGNKSNLETITAQNATSIKDRDELNRKAVLAETKIAGLESLVSQNEERNSQKLGEIETQFDSLAQTGNTILSYQVQKNADFQNALSSLHATMPTAVALPPFYPNISNRDGGKKK